MNEEIIKYTSALPAGRDFSIKITPAEPVYWEGYDEFRVTYQIEVIYLDQDRKLPFNEAVGKIKTLGDLDDLSEILLTRIKNILDQDNFFDIDSISVPSKDLDLTQRKNNPNEAGQNNKENSKEDLVVENKDLNFKVKSLLKKNLIGKKEIVKEIEGVKNNMEEVKSDIQNIKKDFMVIFGIFASFITFVSVEFSIINNSSNLGDFISLTLLLLGSLSFFVVILQSTLQGSNEEFWKKNLVRFSGLLILVSILIFVIPQIFEIFRNKTQNINIEIINKQNHIPRYQHNPY